MTDWRERFDEVEREAREREERKAPNRARNAATEDLYERILGDDGPKVAEIDDAEVLRDLLHLALMDVAYHRDEEERREQELHEFWGSATRSSPGSTAPLEGI